MSRPRYVLLVPSGYILDELNKIIAAQQETQYQLSHQLPRFQQQLRQQVTKPTVEASTFAVLGGITAVAMKEFYIPPPLAAVLAGRNDRPTTPGPEESDDGKYIVHLLRLFQRAHCVTRDFVGAVVSLDSRKQASQTNNPALLTVEQTDDMYLIRQCELVIMAEEHKFGVHCRDLTNTRLVPVLQALVEQSEMELCRSILKQLIRKCSLNNWVGCVCSVICRDDYRPITEPSATLSHAPHARSCPEVGVCDEPWVPPSEAWKSVFSRPDAVRNFFVDEASIQARLMGVVWQISRHMDKSLTPFNRGETKIGGHMHPILTRFSETRARRPLIPSITSKMEFNKQRKICMCMNRLAEIEEERKKLWLEFFGSGEHGGLLFRSYHTTVMIELRMM
jgi:hypothetical protein